MRWWLAAVSIVIVVGTASASSPHGERFDAVRGGCASCHVARSWKVMTFDHARQTRFGLRGKHGTISCRGCHRGTGPADFERFTSPSCTGCHAHATVHVDAAHPKGRFTDAECHDCHGPAWNRPRTSLANIAHGVRSLFPLVKGHKVVPCLDCHPRDARGQIRGSESVECGARCHADAHDGRLGARCTACHAPGLWDAVNFDHDHDPFPDGSRGYALEGDHARLPCAACHRASPRFAGTPRRCADAACHAADDSHRGQLGTTCDRCHLANGDNRFNHAIMSRFPLDGKHTRVACADCHPGGAFKPRPRTCYGCHPEPRAHYRMYGTLCERCHTTAAWR